MVGSKLQPTVNVYPELVSTMLVRYDTIEEFNVDSKAEYTA